MNTFLKALEQMAKGVRQIDLGDMAARPNVGARMQAVQRLLEDATNAATKADDWGWKGAPEGRLSSKDALTEIDNVRKEAFRRLWDRGDRSLNDMSGSKYVDEMLKEETRLMPNSMGPILRQWQKGGILDEKLSSPIFTTGTVDLGDLEVIANSFKALEDAGIPWEYTGKTYKALKAFLNEPKLMFDGFSDREAQRMSDFLRPMTDDQRETFLSLLPEWEDSLEELAELARTI